MPSLLSGIFITGTDTDVGKTHIACLISKQLVSQGFSISPRKPVESGCQGQLDDLVPKDALALKTASNSSEPLSTICPYPLKAAISPAEAARLENSDITIHDLVTACNTDQRNFLLVEGAGGFYSPLCTDGLNADLAQALKLPIVLVVSDKLGCINHALLTIEAIQSRELNLIAVVLNSFQNSDVHMNNAKELRQLTNTRIIETRGETPDILPPEIIKSLKNNNL